MTAQFGFPRKAKFRPSQHDPTFFLGEHAFVNWTYSIFFHVSIGVKITKRNHHHPFPSLAMSQGGIWDSMSNIQLRKEFSFWLKKNCLRRCGGLTFRKLTTRKENCKSTQQCLLDALLATTRLSYSKPIYPKWPCFHHWKNMNILLHWPALPSTTWDQTGDIKA